MIKMITKGTETEISKQGPYQKSFIKNFELKQINRKGDAQEDTLKVLQQQLYFNIYTKLKQTLYIGTKYLQYACKICLDEWMKCHCKVGFMRLSCKKHEIYESEISLTFTT